MMVFVARAPSVCRGFLRRQCEKFRRVALTMDAVYVNSFAMSTFRREIVTIISAGLGCIAYCLACGENRSPGLCNRIVA